MVLNRPTSSLACWSPVSRFLMYRFKRVVNNCIDVLVEGRFIGTYAESGPTQFDDFRNYF